MGLFKSVCRPRKPTLLNVTWRFLFPPPPRPEKNHPQPTQKRLPIKTFSSPMLCLRGKFPGHPPATNELCGPRRGFVSGTNKRPRVSTVKNTHLKTSRHRIGTTTWRSPHQMQPNVCPCNGPGLPAHPPQSGGQPAHLPLLPHTGLKRPTRRQDSQKSWKFFIFLVQSWVLLLNFTYKIRFCTTYRLIKYLL